MKVVRFLQKRKIKALGKIFPNAVIIADKIERTERQWFEKTIVKQGVYIVTSNEIRQITHEQTKQLEKKRLRITSIDFNQGQIILQRKLKVFDWFLIYGSMRIMIGVLAFYGLVVWLG